jgi:LPS export ABC transporter permease LptG
MSADNAMTQQSTTPLRRGWKQSFWTRLDSYICGEITKPFLSAMLIYNGIFFIRVLAKATELTSGQYDIPLYLIAIFFVTEIPAILMVTTPLSFLFASIAAVSRMSVDSEMIAPQSLGLGYWRLSRPVVTYGLMLTLLLSVFTHFLGPRLNRVWQNQYRAFANDLSLPNIQPGVINPLGDRSVLYVDDVQEGRLVDLFFINHSSSEEEILLAERASIFSNKMLQLDNAIKIDFSKEGEQSLEIVTAQQLEQLAPLGADLSEDRLRHRSYELMDTLSLYATLHNPNTDPGIVHRMQLDFWGRIIGPLVCFIFGFYGIPVAARHARSRRSSGFVLSLFFIGFYLMFFKLTTDLAEQDKLSPFVGHIITPVAFLLLGLLIMLGKQYQWPNPLLLLKEGVQSALKSVVRFFKRLFFRSTPATETLHGVNNGKPKPTRTLLFPSRLDRYIIKSFLSIFILVQCSILLLVLLVEYTQIAQDISENSIDLQTTARYMFNKIPEMLDMSISLSLLIATLVLLATMSKSQEVTAVRAAGGSLIRLCMPLVMLGVLFNIASFYLSNEILPYSNRQAFNLRNIIKDRQDVTFTRDQWLKNERGDLFNYQFFDPDARRIVGLRRFSMRRPDQFGDMVLQRVDIPSLEYNGAWKTTAPGEVWTFWESEKSEDSNMPGDISATPSVLPEGQELDLDLTLDDLNQKRRRASEFNIAELQEYMQYVSSLGVSSANFQTEWYAKFAQPLMPLVMMLLAMPMGFQFGRRGTVYGIGVGLVLGLCFWGMFVLVKEMGASGLLPPIVAGWSVVLMVGFGALYRFLQLE